MKITKQDEQALRAALRRKPRKVHELRTLMRERLYKQAPQTVVQLTRSGGRVYCSREAARAADQLAYNAVARLLGEWKLQGLVDNPTRGTWKWVGK